MWVECGLVGWWEEGGVDGWPLLWNRERGELGVLMERDYRRA